METNLLVGMNIHRAGYESYPAADLEKNIDACKEMGLDMARAEAALKRAMARISAAR